MVNISGKLDELYQRGFDLSYYLAGGKFKVWCSKCDALVINGVACHETGCPNIPRDYSLEEEE